MTQPHPCSDPGNPPQTFTFQYHGITEFDGTTAGREFSRDETNTELYVAPNLAGIYDIDQNGPLGYVDPDGVPGTGASMGDRFILWLEIVVNEPTTLQVELRDAEDYLLLEEIIPATAVVQVLYHSVHFRVPQGAVLAIRGLVGNSGGRVRVRSALAPDDCCDGAADGGGGGGGGGGDGTGVARQEFPLGDDSFIASPAGGELTFSWFEAALNPGQPTLTNTLVARRSGTVHGLAFLQRNNSQIDLEGDFTFYVNGVAAATVPAAIPYGIATDIPFPVAVAISELDLLRVTFTPTVDHGGQNAFSITGSADFEWAQ